MISYVRQVAICGPVLEMIKQAVSQSDDKNIRTKVIHIPTTESVLRVVSVLPNLDTEEKLRDFAIEHALSNLHLTEIQRERLNFTS